VNRKEWIIAGIIVTALFAVGIYFLLHKQTDNPEVAVSTLPVSTLTYCTDEQVKPCVVSFGIDEDNNMLVNILLPGLSFPDFYLNIIRGEITIPYECQRIVAAPNSANCIGENLPPGELLHLMLLSTENDSLLADGNLSIIGLAFPTVGFAPPTETVTPTVIPPTATESISTATSTRAPTQPSYP